MWKLIHHQLTISATDFWWRNAKKKTHKLSYGEYLSLWDACITRCITISWNLTLDIVSVWSTEGVKKCWLVFYDVICMTINIALGVDAKQREDPDIAIQLAPHDSMQCQLLYHKILFDANTLTLLTCQQHVFIITSKSGRTKCINNLSSEVIGSFSSYRTVIIKFLMLTNMIRHSQINRVLFSAHINLWGSLSLSLSLFRLLL